MIGKDWAQRWRWETCTGWTNSDKPNASVIASDGQAKDSFGLSIALSPTIAVVGAPQHSVNGQTFQGAAYVYGEQ